MWNKYYNNSNREYIINVKTFVKVWDNQRTEDMLVLVNNATRFIIAIYKVKRKDLKNVADMMRTAIKNMLLSMNINPELVGEYKVVRRIIVPGNLEFSCLHKLLQFVFGWKNHLCVEFELSI